MKRRFHTLDVFTAQRFSGNPLAVVTDSQDLGSAAMQAVAREFNLSETVFVLPNRTSGRASVRIFTPAREIPFAGHPTVGTAVLLALLDGTEGPSEIVLEEGVGPVICSVSTYAGGGRASFRLPREPSRLDTVASVERLAAALSLTLDDIGCDGFAPENWTAGNAFTCVPVRGLDALGRARPDMALWNDVFGPDDPHAAYLFCLPNDDQAHFRTRMFAPAHGVPEDPATGSAAAAFAGLLAASGRYRDGEHEVAIAQGVEMGRPSLIRVGMTLNNGALAAASVGGDAVTVSEGSIEA